VPVIFLVSKYAARTEPRLCFPLPPPKLYLSACPPLSAR
jgi:hypothetical protein